MNKNKITKFIECKCKNCGKWNSIIEGTRKAIKCTCGFNYLVDKAEKKETYGIDK